MSENFLKAVQAADLADGQSIPVELNGWPVLVCRNEGQIYAVINRCTHASATLEEGRIRKGSVICPLHGARFSLKDGGHMTLPAVAGVKRYEVQVVDAQILIAPAA